MIYMRKKFSKKIIKYSVILIIFLSLIIFALNSYFNEGLAFSLINQDLDSIESFVDSFGTFSYFIFILLVILEVVFAPVPPLVLYIAGGFLFGNFLGGFLTLIGNIIGALIAFNIGKILGEGFIEKRIDYSFRTKFNKFLNKYGGLSIFFLRINPLTTSDIFSYLAGLSKMRLKPFLVGTTLGLTPLIFIQTYIGGSLIKDNPILTLIALIIGIIYLLIFFYLVFYLSFKKKFNKKV